MISFTSTRKTDLKDKLFNTGVSLIIVSFVTCVISFYIFIIGVPVFLVGVILVWLSDKNAKIKFLFTLTPLFAYVPCVILFLYVWNWSPPKTFVLPADLRGHFWVVYGESCGNEPNNEKGRILYPIPPNRVLIVKSERQEGLINHKYYIRQQNGKLIEIREASDPYSRQTNYPVVLFLGSGTTSEAIEIGSPSSKVSNDIHYNVFYL